MECHSDLQAALSHLEKQRAHQMRNQFAIIDNMKKDSKIEEKDKKTETVRVAVRCRPLNQREQKEKRQIAVTVDYARTEIIVRTAEGEEKQFSYDQVFAIDSVQDQVFSETGLPIVEGVLQGYNGTIFAYGQTGTGKTFTMEGDVRNEVLKGIMPRSFDHIFKVISGTPNINFLVRASMLELYNEEIIDLLVNANPREKLELHETPDKGVFVKKLSQYNIKSSKEMLGKLLQGSDNRHTGQTKMNDKSSRSHSLFQITIEMAETLENGEQKIRRGKLNLVDLAGSERLKRTGAENEQRREGICINQSLSNLGKVIYNLTDPSNPHVPFRDSKLTRLLQDSLGGNTKTVLIANISPAEDSVEETLNTLRFASRAKKIKVKPRINEDPKDAKIRELESEIIHLREMLQKKKGLYNGPVGGLSSGASEEQRGQFLNDIEKRIQAEKKKIKNATKEERRILEEQLIKIEEQKKKFLHQLESKENENKITQSEIQKLEEQLREKNEFLLKGDKLKAEARRHQKMTMKAKQQLEDRKREEQRLKQQENEITKDFFERKQKYNSLKEEVEAKTKALQQIVKKVKEAKEHSNQIHEFRSRQKEQLMEQNRELLMEIKRFNLIIENFVPQSQLLKLQERLQFSEEMNDWVVKKEFQFKKPGSSIKLKRPMCDYSRLAISNLDTNPRHRPDNILFRDVEVIERITEDLDVQDSQISPIIKKIISATLEDDEEIKAEIAEKTHPFVYVMNAEEMSKEKVIKNQEQRQARNLKSAFKKTRKQ